MIVLFIQYMNTIKSICTFSCVLLSLHLWTTPNNSKQQNTKLLLSTVLPCLRCNISGDCYWDCAGTIHGAGWSVCILLAARKEYAACLQRICTMGTNSAQWHTVSVTKNFGALYCVHVYTQSGAPVAHALFSFGP